MIAIINLLISDIVLLRLLCGLSVVGIMYFRSASHVLRLARYMSAHAGKGLNDMEIVGQYRKECPDDIVPLPLLDLATYPDVVDPMFATNVYKLKFVFDAAAYGQVCHWGSQQDTTKFVVCQQPCSGPHRWHACLDASLEVHRNQHCICRL